LLTVIVAVLTVIILAMVFYGWQLFGVLLAHIGLEVTSPLLLVSIQWISILLIMLLACEVIYNLLPDFKEFTWIWITPGSLVAILLWIVLTNVFRVYLGYFDTYDRAYGSLGAVMIPDLKVLASGGVRGIDDIKQFQDMGLFAVIFGKAYYEGILKLEEIEHFLVSNKV
jgi:hypothetical protein